MARRLCAFCQSEATLTGEHLWSAWVGKLFPSIVYDFRRTDATGIRGQWSLPRLEAKAKVVCKPCNEGWMSRLEEEAKLILKSVIGEGYPVSLLPKSIPSLAAFAFKGAVVANHMNIGEQPFFSASTRSHFRESLDIPVGMQMWIASYSGEKLRGDFSGYRFRPSEGFLADAEFYVFTYAVGYLVLQVLAPRWRENHRGNENPPILSPDRVWEPVSIQFWPDTKRPVTWPPLQDLSDDSLKVFHERWQASIAYQGG